MKRFITIFFVLLGVVAAGQPRAASAAVIDDTAGPVDYGAATPAQDTDLRHLTAGDLRQGYGVANCWLLSPLAAIVHQRADTLVQNYSITSSGLADVRLYTNGLPTDYLVTTTINTWWGDPYTSYDDSNGCAAGNLIEKAYALKRSPSNTMADESWGIPAEAIDALGWRSQQLPPTISAIISAFEDGAIVCLDTGYNVPAGMVSNHSYSVWSVDAAAGTILLRSPWGDGYAGYNEYTTVTQQQLTAFNTGVWAGWPGGVNPHAVVEVPEPRYAFAVGAAAALLGRRKRRAA